MSDCIFCKIANKQVPSTIVCEDEHAVAFRDLKPMASTHVLVVPKKHIKDLREAEPQDEQLLGHLLTMAAEVAKMDGVSESGFRVVINAGPDAGQSVDHLHVHVLGGRHLSWPPG